MKRLPADFRQVEDGSSLYSWHSRRCIQSTAPAPESWEVGSGPTSWLPLPGSRSAVMLAPLRGLPSVRDRHGADRRLPGIRTLDIWEPWRRPTPTFPDTRSAVILAPLRGSSHVRDSHGGDRRLPGIRTLDIWEPWWRPTHTLPETVGQRDPPDNVAIPNATYDHLEFEMQFRLEQNEMEARAHPPTVALASRL